MWLENYSWALVGVHILCKPCKAAVQFHRPELGHKKEASSKMMFLVGGESHLWHQCSYMSTFVVHKRGLGLSAQQQYKKHSCCSFIWPGRLVLWLSKTQLTMMHREMIASCLCISECSFLTELECCSTKRQNLFAVRFQVLKDSVYK